MITVALVGPDGAGKSTISRQLPAALPFPTAHVYMGVNLESSNLVLPTTRLLLRIKRHRGGRPDMSASFRDHVHEAQGGRSPAKHLLSGAKSFARLVNLVAEEWFRQAVIWAHKARGRVVVLDRHFFIDYHVAEQAFSGSGRSLAGRIHTWLLRHTYPRPDLTICLDAPAEVLLSRKGEGTLESLESRRRAYLGLRECVPLFERVDATLPTEEVVAAVAALIIHYSQPADLTSSGASPSRTTAIPD